MITPANEIRRITENYSAIDVTIRRAAMQGLSWCEYRVQEEQFNKIAKSLTDLGYKVIKKTTDRFANEPAEVVFIIQW